MRLLLRNVVSGTNSALRVSLLQSQLAQRLRLPPLSSNSCRTEIHRGRRR
jgi:hypothetical protein